MYYPQNIRSKYIFYFSQLYSYRITKKSCIKILILYIHIVVAIYSSIIAELYANYYVVQNIAREKMFLTQIHRINLN